MRLSAWCEKSVVRKKCGEKKVVGCALRIITLLFQVDEDIPKQASSSK